MFSLARVMYLVVHEYWYWALSARVLKWYRIWNRTVVTAKFATISALLHIVTDGTRYTEHTVDVHSNRSKNATE